MVIKRLYIENFRCFGEDPAIIKFSKTGLMAFIGCNNAGKSTALKALEILLGDKWPMSQFSEDDFYNKQHDRKIILACEFAEPITIVPSKRSPDTTMAVRGLVIEASYLETGYGQSSVDVEYRLLSQINNFETGDWEIACYGGGTSPIYVSQDIRNVLPIAITIPLIKLQSEQPTNKWGVLGRMLQKIENAFSSDQARVERFEEQIGNAVGVLREPDQFRELEQNVRSFWEGVRPFNLSGTALEFLDYDPWHYYRQFRLAITKNGDNVPLDSLGEGVQRLAVIALYRAYLNSHTRNQQALLLVEEPESYLHPQARSVVYQTLRKAVEGEDAAEGQIVYTTHSSDFIDCSNFEEIAIFSETEEGSVARQVSIAQMKCQTETLLGIPMAEQGDPGIYYRLVEVDSLGLKDSLFGNKALIVEGSSDYEFFRAFGKTEEKQISIVVAGGKAHIKPIYSFLTAFGIPTLVCADRDTDDTATNDQMAMLVNDRIVNNLEEGETVVTGSTIDALTDGTMAQFKNLLIFSADMEGYLATEIPNYTDLTRTLRTGLNLGRSKSKLAFALALCAKGKLPEVATCTRPQLTAFGRVARAIQAFLDQDISKPEQAVCNGGIL